MLKSNFKLIMARGTTYEDLYKYAQEVITWKAVLRKAAIS